MQHAPKHGERPGGSHEGVGRKKWNVFQIGNETLTCFWFLVIWKPFGSDKLELNCVDMFWHPGRGHVRIRLFWFGPTVRRMSQHEADLEFFAWKRWREKPSRWECWNSFWFRFAFPRFSPREPIFKPKQTQTHSFYFGFVRDSHNTWQFALPFSFLASRSSHANRNNKKDKCQAAKTLHLAWCVCVCCVEKGKLWAMFSVLLSYSRRFDGVCGRFF